MGRVPELEPAISRRFGRVSIFFLEVDRSSVVNNAEPPDGDIPVCNYPEVQALRDLS
jgi:hypothetical protein